MQPSPLTNCYRAGHTHHVCARLWQTTISKGADRNASASHCILHERRDQGQLRAFVPPLRLPAPSCAAWWRETQTSPSAITPSASSRVPYSSHLVQAVTHADAFWLRQHRCTLLARPHMLLARTAGSSTFCRASVAEALLQQGQQLNSPATCTAGVPSWRGASSCCAMHRVQVATSILMSTQFADDHWRAEA
jgi:hypothetical protein